MSNRDLVTLPDYFGGSLVNLVAELEHRLTGSSAAPRLHPELASVIPMASTYVLVLYDGLGSRQLDHPAAASLSEDERATIDAPFPTTTTVSLSTVATGLPPSQHGILGYQLWMPQLSEVANTIKWTTLWGEQLDIDTTGLLPAPNLWERLERAGVEPITVQPANFAESPLSQLLYRGCRYEGIVSTQELIDATRQLAATPGRLIFAYMPHVDFAAHVYGQRGSKYAQAVSVADYVWSALRATLPADTVMVGTADHGHTDFPKTRQVKIPRGLHDELVFYGDSRVMFVRGDGAAIARATPARWLTAREIDAWWGPTPYHCDFENRRPDGVLVADDRHILLHRHSDDRLIGHHGGLTDAERRIPLLVAG